jgi:hypothetical protein
MGDSCLIGGRFNHWGHIYETFLHPLQLFGQLGVEVVDHRRRSIYSFRYSDAKTFGTVSVVSKEMSWIMMASKCHPHKYELPLVLVPECTYQCLNRAKLIQLQFLYGIRRRRATGGCADGDFNALSGPQT